MFAWLAPVWSALQTAARATGVAVKHAAKVAAQAVRKATVAAAKWTKATAAKVGHAVRMGAGRAKDWLTDMRSPQLRQARWYARGAHKSLARADASFARGESASWTNFELQHAQMELANVAKLRSGTYPQPRLARPHAQLSGTQAGSAMSTANTRQSGPIPVMDLPTLSADTATGHTLARSLREVAEAARRGAAEATARAEALRAQAAAMDDKPDLADAAAGLLAEAAMWEEKAQSRLGTAAAYEDAATAAETEEGK